MRRHFYHHVRIEKIQKVGIFSNQGKKNFKQNFDRLVKIDNLGSPIDRPVQRFYRSCGDDGCKCVDWTQSARFADAKLINSKFIKSNNE